ncbi:hypothetical protein PENSPDRAFT_758152 [Peniophora sp. CONT]|nr:hypothetical protein PENSPDRAFT_758152 [Peniophora sp. CONT]
MATLSTGSSSIPIAVASPDDAFRELWSEALRKCEQSLAGNSSQWRSLLQRMHRCREAEDVCVILDETMQAFERFRGSETAWGKLRSEYLKPAVEVLLLFNDAIAETAASFPHVPGGKAIFVAFGVLLQATKGVSAYCEALIALFEELNSFLESLRPRLRRPSGLGSASKAIAITMLAHLLDIICHTAKLVLKRPWLGRLGLYGKALLKDTRMQAALQRLRALTNLELRAMTSEIYVNAAGTHDLALEIRDAATGMQADVAHIRAVGAENIGVTNQLLSDLQILNEGRVQATAARGLIERGVNKLIRGQKEMLAFLRAEREQQREDHEKIDAARIFEKLHRVDSADIDAQDSEGCMKGTRVKILRDLDAWSHEHDAPRIYWLNGMAGTGKSAIARSFCHMLQRGNLLGGSFFCSRGGSVQQGDARRIIPTLAASVASCNMAFNKHLLAELIKKPFSIHWNLALQIEQLLKIPLSSVDKGSPMLVLIVDALDECTDEDITRDLLSRLVELSGMLPVKFFLTSRPEPHIRQQLEDIDPSLGQILRLHDIEQDIVKADISRYLSHGLRAMREPSFPPKWPQKEDIAALTRLSGKLFIYAFTALQYLRKDPVGRLPKLTGTTVTAGRPLTQPLDNIYFLILSEAMDQDVYETEEIDSTRRMIAAIISVREPMTVNSLGRLLGMTASRLRASLNHLHAVIYIPIRDDSGVLSTFHASFSDYLTTPSRAPEHMRDPMSNSHMLLVTACVEALQSNSLHFNVSRAISSYLPNTAQELAHIDDALRYACMNWAYHAAAATKATTLELMLEAVFLGPRFLFWLEALSAMGLAEKATDVLKTAQKMSIRKDSRLGVFIEAAINFTERFSPAYAGSAPHVYLSALAFCRKRSIIGRCCFSAFSGIPNITISNGDADKQYGAVLSAAYSPDGTSITVATEGGIIAYREAHDWRSPAYITTVSEGRSVNFSKSGTHFAYLFDDFIELCLLEGRTVHVRDINDWCGGMEFVVISEDGAQLAAGSSSTPLVVWDTRTRKRLIKWTPFSSEFGKGAVPGPKQPLHAVFSRDGSLVAHVGPSSEGVILFDVRSQWQAHRTFALAPHGHIGIVTCIEFSSDGTQLISGSEDCTVCLWEVSSGKVVTRIPAHSAAISTLACSLDGKWFISGSLDGIIQIWDMETVSPMWKPLHQIGVLQPIRSISFSPDSTKILCITESGAIQVWHRDPAERPSNRRKTGVAMTRIDDDGWLRGPNGELLLWVHPNYRKSLTNPECSVRIYNGVMGIEWTSAQGADWTHCYAGK